MFVKNERNLMIEKRNHFAGGFSFLELMMALVVIGLILGFIAPRLGGLLFKGRVTSTRVTLKVIDQAIQTYKATVGSLPNSLIELNNQPQGVRGWDGPYLPEKFTDALPQDAWNQDFVYEKKERGVKPPYDLYSLGDPDAAEEQRIVLE